MYQKTTQTRKSVCLSKPFKKTQIYKKATIWTSTKTVRQKPESEATKYFHGFSLQNNRI